MHYHPLQLLINNRESFNMHAMEFLEKVASSAMTLFWNDSFQLSQNPIHIYAVCFNCFFAGWTRFRGQMIISLQNSQLRTINNVRQKQFSLQLLHVTLWPSFFRYIDGESIGYSDTNVSPIYVCVYTEIS